jgi:hypothetical protein
MAITELRFRENGWGRSPDIGMCTEKRGAGNVVLTDERHDHG